MADLKSSERGTDLLGEALAVWDARTVPLPDDSILPTIVAAARNWHTLTSNMVYVDAHKQLHPTSGKFEWRVERWVDGSGRYVVFPLDALTVTTDE